MHKRVEAEKNGDRDRKAFYKLMNNAVYGKTMENLRNVSLANNNKNYLKWTAKPSFITRKIFDNNLVEIHKIKTTLTLNKPGYVGMCMLEISKSSSL